MVIDSDRIIPVSVIIPTRNRPESLQRVIRSLHEQTCPVKEIIIVDASDDATQNSEFLQESAGNLIHKISTLASVCYQRNTGIGLAKSEWLFLCDDDIELPPKYLELLIRFIKTNPDAGAVSGQFYLKNQGGDWVHEFYPPGLKSLLWGWLFQLPLWADIKNIKIPALLQPVINPVLTWYTKKGNHVSLGGWPLITSMQPPVFSTTIFSLQACLVKKDWLSGNLFDENLDAYGLGDNYGVAWGFPRAQGIHVLTDVFAKHHKSPENRLDANRAYFRRVLALHYFLCTKPGFGRWNRIFLVWSLAGNFIAQFLTGNFRKSLLTIRAVMIIAAGRNPLLRK